MIKTAVIYARYSSHSQRDVSIEDQIRVCRDYCKRENIQVVKEYFDAAMTGTNDQRPDFQRMIANAPESDYVVVYQMDRFSRNQFDAPFYKRELIIRGVKLLSATENIPDTPEGVFMEKLLEGQAAYYSLNLSRTVKRGMNSNAQKCMANGVMVFGYDVDQDQHYVVNDADSIIVKEIFLRYVGGEPIKSIADDLRRRGFRSREGKPVGYSFVQTVLHNEKYTGVYKWGDVRIPDGMPRIISQELFEMAQKVVHKKVRANEEFAEYKLTGKLYCGICGQAMHGESANGHGGKYYYYACQRGGNCARRNIRREVLETAVAHTVELVVSDEEIARAIAEAFVKQYGGDDTKAALKANEKRMKENRKAVTAIGDAIEKGIELPDVKERIARLNDEMVCLEAERGRLRAEEMKISADDIVEFLTQGVKAMEDIDIIDGFVSRVYLFEDYAVVTMNFKGEANYPAEVRIALDELEQGDLKFVLDWDGWPTKFLVEPFVRIIYLHNGIGLALKIAA